MILEQLFSLTMVGYLNVLSALFGHIFVFSLTYLLDFHVSIFK